MGYIRTADDRLIPTRSVIYYSVEKCCGESTDNFSLGIYAHFARGDRVFIACINPATNETVERVLAWLADNDSGGHFKGKIPPRVLEYIG